MTFPTVHRPAPRSASPGRTASRWLAAATLASTMSCIGTGYSQDPARIGIEVDASRPAGTLEPFWASQIIHPTERLLTDDGARLLQLMADSGAARQFIRIYNQP